MKKILVLFTSLLVILLLSGCEHPIVGMEALSYPDKLVYVAGVDKELDLTGGVIQFVMEDGSEKDDEELLWVYKPNWGFVMEDGSEKDDEEPNPGDMTKAIESNGYWSPCELETNANLGVPGIYTVKIIKHETAYVEFPILVVSQEWLQE